MAVGLVAHINVLEGKEAEFEMAFDQQAKIVREKEPGNQLYRLFRSREIPGEYVIMEIYDDQAAFEAHANSEHLQASRPVMLPLRNGKARLTMVDAV